MSVALKKRNPALDVVRCCALLFVISIHFFLCTDFYNQTMVGWVSCLMCILRTLFLCCVPMFMMLSGTLLIGKRLSRSYYCKLIDTLGIYLLASFCCIIANLIDSRIAGYTFSLPYEILGIFSFITAPYSWYINMYIGLFLLIPFLNILYANLGSQQEKLGLILTLLLLSALPNAINIFRFNSLQWWFNPASNDQYQPLLPGFWTCIYPIFYYYLGAYLSEYPLKMKQSTCVWLILGWTILFGLFQFYRSYGTVFADGPWQEWGSAYVAVGTVLIYHLLSHIDLTRCSEKTLNWLSRLSGLCLGAYLVSAIFDRWFYRILNNSVEKYSQKIPFFFLIVPAVYICSLVLSALIQWLYDHLRTIVSACRIK